jgi:demethylmenaquinone methyltransferase/2-methoxy-6-polyprenyl-1,4-benzoquinol methylase
MRKLDHFDILAPIYERFISRPNLEPLLGLLDLAPGQRLLDAGGGTGRVSGSLTELVENVFLTDISWGMLQQAGSRPALSRVNSHAERLPFPDDSFERILMVDAFHHVCDQVETAAELLRVLAPGGRLVVEEPDIRRFAVKLVALGEKLALMRSHFVRPEKMKTLFERQGGRASIHTHPDDEANVWLVVEK